ncbi:MAG: acyl-CoA dehydrogenase [Hyphomicrobiaceae bacterium]
MSYEAPIEEMIATLEAAGGLSRLIGDGTLQGLDRDLVRSVLEEAGKFGSGVLAPLNRRGDEIGSHLQDGRVTLPAEWPDAYRQWCEAGWSALPCASEHGGQDLPHLVAMAVAEVWQSSNLAFGLCPILTQGAIEAIEAAASDELKARYLPNMVSGKWTGTMNLTEPQAGSDLGVVKTRAMPQPDGTFRIFGTKIFISYGDHEMTENIIHLVLARLPDAPEGTRGISLFIVPKYLVNADGSIGARNDLRPTGVEEKLGIHSSPTCVMTYGERDGATGYMVGEPNRGLAAMFVMMNRARLAVGIQGVGVAERATQHAVAFARERRQGRAASAPGDGIAPIIEHPDVRRMLLTMRAMTAAARAICYETAGALDASERAEDPARRKAAADKVALLTPVAKSFATEGSVEVASLGIQVHGGMGFVEETGAAQFLRDARILPIYEGTNGIQAIDLVTRKLPLEGGAVLKRYVGELAGIPDKVEASNQPGAAKTAARLADAIAALSEASRWMGERLKSGEIDAALAGATAYQRLFGITAGGCLLARCAYGKGASEAARGRLGALARFFATNIANRAPGLASRIEAGSGSVLEVPARSVRGVEDRQGKGTRRHERACEDRAA